MLCPVLLRIIRIVQDFISKLLTGEVEGMTVYHSIAVIISARAQNAAASGSGERGKR